MTKEEEFILHPEKFILVCGICGKEFLPQSYKQYNNLVCKAKNIIENFIVQMNAV